MALEKPLMRSMPGIAPEVPSSNRTLPLPPVSLSMYSPAVSPTLTSLEPMKAVSSRPAFSAASGLIGVSRLMIGWPLRAAASSGVITFVEFTEAAAKHE